MRQDVLSRTWPTRVGLEYSFVWVTPGARLTVWRTDRLALMTVCANDRRRFWNSVSSTSASNSWRRTNTPTSQSLWVSANQGVNNRTTVVQLPLAASHPPLGCRAFVACTNLRYAFGVSVHLAYNESNWRRLSNNYHTKPYPFRSTVYQYNNDVLVSAPAKSLM